MEFDLTIKMNSKLYLRDPEQSLIGKRIVRDGLALIIELGFENFTFKKLAQYINTTEATIYRYFENKHRLLIYLISWYWSMLEYKFIFYTNNITSPEIKLKKIIKLLAEPIKETGSAELINEKLAYELFMREGSKAYFTHNVASDNKDKLFKPYKDLCADFTKIILEFNPKYKYPHSLASTILETAHSQKYFMHNLPALTDFGKSKDEKQLMLFLENILFGALKSKS